MIRKSTRNNQTVFTGTAADLTAASEWARALFHLLFGPTEGEARFRKVPAKAVLSLWAAEDWPHQS